MSGNYPDGVNEFTRNAPWNQYAIETCNGCGRDYYSDGEPDAPQPDAMTGAPETDHGRVNRLCETCEVETDICTGCGEARLIRNGATPRATDGCASCEPDAKQCGACGARQFVLLGTLRETQHLRCRNCGAESYNASDETRNAIQRAADISEQTDKGEK